MMIFDYIVVLNICSGFNHRIGMMFPKITHVFQAG